MGNSRRLAPHLVPPLRLDAVSPRTPGPIGFNDAGDPTRTALLGDTPGVVGYGDWADPTKYHHPLRLKNWVHAMEPLLPTRTALNALSKLSRPHILGPGLPAKEPSNIASAPRTITWSGEVEQALERLQGWTVRDGKEWGATVASDASGELSVIYSHSDNSTLSVHEEAGIPDRTLALVATVHTHPSGLGFSGGDIARMINDKRAMKILRVNSEEFAMVRTSATSAAILSQSEMQDRQLRIREALIREGVDNAEAHRESSRMLAEEYGLAYYEGRAGRLSQVRPVHVVSKR